MYRLIFTRSASEEIILRDFHALEGHLLKLKANTNVSRRGGLGVIEVEVPLSEMELRDEIVGLGLGDYVDITVRG